MRVTRRQFTVGLGAAVLVGCKDKSGPNHTGDTALTPAPDRPAEPAAWAPTETEDAATFAWGVQVGDVTTTGAVVSVRSLSASLGLRIVRGDGESWTEIDGQAGLVPTDGTLQVELEGLSEDTVYSLVFVDEAGGGRSPVARLRTATGAGSWRTLTLGATSCLGGNEPWPNLSFAAVEDLDVFLLLGDIIYSSSTDLEGYRAEYGAALSTLGLKEVMASTSVVSTWDDHEVANNWSWETNTEDQIYAALAAYREAIPQRQGPGGLGIWHLQSWGAILDLIVLDCRSERLEGRYISLEQMAWLKSTLSSSTARFKFILNSVPITDMTNIMSTVHEEDRWQGFPEQREEILSYIRDEAIGGVLWIAGDHHFGMISTVDLPGGTGEDQWEVLVGPGGSTINPVAVLKEPDEQYQVLVGEWNYTKFRLDPELGTVEVSFVGDDGATIASKTLTL